MGIIGEMMSADIREKNVEWVIPNFSLLFGKYYDSPIFSFNNKSWYLRVYPNGQKEKGSTGFVDLYLKSKFPCSEIHHNFSLSFKSSDGMKEEETHYMHTFTEEDEGRGSICFIEKTELLRRKLSLLPNNSLTVICTLKYSETNKNANDTCPCQDFKKMLFDGLNHDLTLKVGDNELQAHKDVLRARSEVFNSMLTHDMIERNTGVVDIPDCDLQTMKQFLSYIYCGKVDTLEEKNIYNLYYIADKYDMKGLKEDCSIFMKNSLSVTNICEVIQLALNHGDCSLLECGKEYFKKNMADIICTVEWEFFIKEHFTEANTLLINSIVNLNNSKT